MTDTIGTIAVYTAGVWLTLLVWSVWSEVRYDRAWRRRQRARGRLR